jgi:lipopolysaccharide/colanic/teichoic acid biosynthesis glycosyltransferase
MDPALLQGRTPMATLRRLAHTFKRPVETLTAAALLVATLPLLAAMALWIRLDSPGHPFFVQTRIGRHGRPFRLLKLRTLYVDRFGIDVNAELSLNDPRVTRPGRWLRRSKLDELPQLWHVLTGEMALVGPRPDIPEQVARYTPQQRLRLAVRPGLTGAAQVSGNTALSWDQRILIDRWYIRHWSLALDLRILGATAWAIAGGEDVPNNRLGLPAGCFDGQPP